MTDSKRILHLCIGIPLCALGVHIGVQANIGLAPWDAFSMGISLLTGISFGAATIVTGIGILALDVMFREKIGIGTLANTFVIGWLISFLDWINLFPQAQCMLVGLPMLLLGQLLNCVGTYYYISSALGCGPRDTLMVAFGKRMPKTPIGLVRGCIEGGALLTGWLLGAKIGLGTVIAVFGISFILQGTFHFFRFEVRSIVHESVFDTFRRRFDLSREQKAKQEAVK